MKFYSPEYLLFLILPVLMFLLWRLFHKKRIKTIKNHFSTENIEEFKLISEEKDKKRWLFRIGLLVGYIFFIIALSRPQFGQKEKSMLISEHSVVFLIDLSRSMLTRDILPSRLEMVKQEIFKSLKILGNLKVGLVVFAGSVDVVSPMTSDLEAIESYVDSLGVDSVSSQGTKIQVGLEESKNLFERTLKDNKGSKLIVLFSDGETHEKESIAYAKKLTQLGYKIITVGIGTESGGYVPESETSSSYIRDKSGRVVTSKPNFKFLKSLALTGEGAFYYLSPIDPLGPKIKNSLDKIQSVAAARQKFIVSNEAYQGFILLGLLCFVLAFIVRRF